MYLLLKSEKRFTFLFVALLILDVVLNNIDDLWVLGYISKVLLISTLFCFFFLNSQNLCPRVRWLVVLAFITFIAGEFLVTINISFPFFVGGFALIILAKVLYSYVFVLNVHFDIDRILPFLVFLTIYSLTVIYFLYDDPKHFEYMIYLLIAIIMVKFAYLRYEKVDKKSFWLVMFGVGLFLVSETMLVFDSGLGSFTLSSILIMFFYGISQYLLVLGMTRQQNRIIYPTEF